MSSATSTQPVAVLNVVGFTPSLLPHAPNIKAYAEAGVRTALTPDLPAVTTTVQSSMLTGQPPAKHGVVGNGWYNRQMCEVQFWKQSNKLVEAEKVWETAKQRDPEATCLNMFWWYNMYSSADYSCTPRPIYKADGRKLPDCYSHPACLRDELQQRLGTFPLFRFWGPATSIESTQWIANAAIYAHAKHQPSLTLVYLPHLDYGLQKLGPSHPDIPQHVAEVDAVVGELLDYFRKQRVAVLIVSEYGIEEVKQAVPINRVLREAGTIAVRVEEGLELLDAGASEAFAIADHQVAHVYVKNPTRVGQISKLLKSTEGVERVLNREQQRTVGVDHERTGELFVIAKPGYWFSYPYWLDDARAPDFARTVDIHRKPGYDPLELFIDPKIALPKLKLAWRLMQKKVLKQRALMDVIPLDTSLVRGSHGRSDMPAELMPLLITPGDVPLPEPDPSAARSSENGASADGLHCRQVRDVILRQMGLGEG